jgi:hypothetical protein
MNDTHENDDGTDRDTTDSRVNRRWVLGSAATAATIGLAGCTNTDDGGDGGDGGGDGGDGGNGSDGGDGGSPDPLVIGGLFPDKRAVRVGG